MVEANNNESYALLTDDELIALCTTKESDIGDDTEETPLSMMINPKVISHNAATSHFEEITVYFERHGETTSKIC